MKTFEIKNNTIYLNNQGVEFKLHFIGNSLSSISGSFSGSLELFRELLKDIFNNYIFNFFDIYDILEKRGYKDITEY